MERGSHTPTGDQAGWLIHTANRIQKEPALRWMAISLLAIEAYVGVVGVGVAQSRLSEHKDEAACEPMTASCLAAADGLDVPAVAESTELPAAPAPPPPAAPAPPATEAPTTTLPPSTTTTLPPPPPAADIGLSLGISLNVTAPQAELPPRQLPYETFVNNQNAMLGNLPSLDKLSQLFPGSAFAHFVPEQKQRISELEAAITPTVEEYNAQNVDISRAAAFADSQNYHNRNAPRAFIIHWTGKGYDNVDHFIASLKPYRVEFYIDKTSQTYQLFEHDNNFPAHALSVNEFTQGVEIETGQYDGVHSPLFSYQPQQLENAVYVAVRFLRRNGLPVDRSTILGHYAADLIFSNPYYDPMSGNFSKQSVRKFDPPQELINVLVAKAQALDAALGPR